MIRISTKLSRGDMMKCNLALHIFAHILVYGSGVGVSLAQYRLENQIPTATFYRHVKNLIDMGFIVRLGRDSYAISDRLLYTIKDYKMPPYTHILPSRQLSMFSSDIPF